MGKNERLYSYHTNLSYEGMQKKVHNVFEGEEDEGRK